MRSTDATPPDQQAPRPLDLVAAAPTPRRGIVAVVVAAVLVALLLRRLRRR
jgi:MYXO-CTERM domain-containing protein